VIGQAHTGTGKTAAYGLPILQLTIPKQGIQGVIMAPTRELAIQITGEINKFARNTGIKTATIYGGQGMGIQFDALRKKPEIIVATPGRLIDHLKRGTIKLNNVKHVVLDEADVMLDMGFIDDIQFILELGKALPDVFSYQTDSQKVEQYSTNKQLVIEFSRRPFEFPNSDKIELHLSAKALLEKKESSWQRGISLKEEDWEALKQFAKLILVPCNS